MQEVYIPHLDLTIHVGDTVIATKRNAFIRNAKQNSAGRYTATVTIDVLEKCRNPHDLEQCYGCCGIKAHVAGGALCLSSYLIEAKILDCAKVINKIVVV